MPIKYHPKTSKEALYLLRRLCKEQRIRIYWNRPMAKGMYHQLKARLGDIMMSGDIYKALGHHVNSHAYLVLMKEGAQRFDINGKVSGVVTAEEAALAHKTRGKKHRKLLNRGRKKGPGQNRRPPGSRTAGPRTSNPRASRPQPNPEGKEKEKSPTVVVKKKRKLNFDQ